MPYFDPLEYYIRSCEWVASTIASIIDAESARTIITRISWIHITDLSETITGNIPNVFSYTKEEEKKSLGIEVIRRFLVDISNKPYAGKAIYLLQDIHTASIEAMNSLLKILEEPPEYAIILLVTNEPNSLLETITSRTIHLHRYEKNIPLPESVTKAIEAYFHGDYIPFITYLYETKYESPQEAIHILHFALKFANSPLLQKIEAWLISLYHVNENPRNILDAVFL